MEQPFSPPSYSCSNPFHIVKSGSTNSLRRPATLSPQTNTPLTPTFATIQNNHRNTYTSKLICLFNPNQQPHQPPKISPNPNHRHEKKFIFCVFLKIRDGECDARAKESTNARMNPQILVTFQRMSIRRHRFLVHFQGYSVDSGSSQK
jgi:hypothetical protein